MEHIPIAPETYKTMNNPYTTLNVQPSATLKEIKKAYRKLSKTHHPDTGGNAEAFAKLSEAYATLSNEESRHFYDTYGDHQDKIKTYEAQFAELIIAALDSHLSVADFCENHIQDRIDKVERKKKNLEKNKVSYQKKLSRVRCLKGTDVVSKTLNLIIDNISSDIDKLEEERSIALFATQRLRDYIFEEEREDHPGEVPRFGKTSQEASDILQSFTYKNSCPLTP